MFYLNLNDMEFFARHGVLDEEKVTPQKFTVDVKIETDQIVTASESDDVNDALNYVGAYELISSIMLNESYNLIETIAKEIAHKLIKAYPMTLSVDVKVTKNNPPISGFTGTVSCEYSAFGLEE